MEMPKFLKPLYHESGLRILIKIKDAPKSSGTDLLFQNLEGRDRKFVANLR